MFGGEVVLQDEDGDVEGLWAPRGAAGVQGLVFGALQRSPISSFPSWSGGDAFNGATSWMFWV